MKPYFEQNNVTIYHGDCREVLPEMAAVDLVLTDPPYAIGGSRKEWRVTAAVAVGLNQTARKVSKGGTMFAFTTTSGRGIEFTLGAIDGALPFNRLLVWHKEFVRSRVAGPWRWDAVSILAFGRASFGRPEQSSVYTTKGPCSNNHLGATRHPAELPDGLAAWLYQPFDRDGITVLDPFCGTGQLLAPAARKGRQVVGIELEEKWAEAAAINLSRQELALGGLR